jgi:hypothetical protein
MANEAYARRDALGPSKYSICRVMCDMNHDRKQWSVLSAMIKTSGLNLRILSAAKANHGTNCKWNEPPRSRGVRGRLSNVKRGIESVERAIVGRDDATIDVEFTNDLKEFFYVV